MQKLILYLILSLQINLFAQNSVHSSGGDASSTSGSVSYSIGQVVYSNYNGSNGSVNQGVQQPFEFFTVGSEKYSNINLNMIVFPNPTQASVVLKIENFNFEKLQFQLVDLQGQILLNEKINVNETPIDMHKLSASTYLLQVFDNQQIIKSFKIIKNQ